MKKNLLGICSLLIAFPALAEVDDVESLLRKAAISAYEEADFGDESAAGRYLGAALKRDPENIRAKWETLFLRLTGIRKFPPATRIQALLGQSKELKDLILKADQGANRSLAFFLKARLASFHGDHSSAKDEIKSAIKIEPENAEYHFWHCRILTDYSEERKLDSISLEAIEACNTGKKIASNSKFSNFPSYAFDMTAGVIHFSRLRPDFKKSIAAYEDAIALMGTTSPNRLASARLRIAEAYENLGDCRSAKKTLELVKKAPPFMQEDIGHKMVHYDFCIELESAQP